MRFSLLCGSAPEDFRQKKIAEMFDFIDSTRKPGDSVAVFPNGVSEEMLEFALGNSFSQNPAGFLLYVCTQTPVKDGEASVWLGGEEIRREVIARYQTLAAERGIDMQVVFDSCGEFVSDEELGYERVGAGAGARLRTGHSEFNAMRRTQN